MISLVAGEMASLSKRELLERCKSLKAGIEELREDCNDPDLVREMPYLPNALASCTQEYNEHYVLLFRRMFRKHKNIYRLNPYW